MKHSIKIRYDIRDAIDDIWKLYSDGLTGYDIAAKYDVSRCTITTLLKKNGYILRGSHKRKGSPPWNKGIAYHQIRGDKNPRWKGGITNLNQQVRHCVEYKNWIRGIFKRDDFTCAVCRKRGGDLEADHYPKRFSEIMRDHDIRSLSDAEKCSELWDTKNGRTLCLKCHNRTKQVRSRFKKVCVTNM